MKYEMTVHVYLRPEHGGNALELRETQNIELVSLSDAAGILVKLHEFFEELRKRKI